MSARRFDAKFGANRLDEVPRAPGVYEWLGPAEETLYVGKAANLRDRLRQYRNARRTKAHRKMRELVAAASGLRVCSCESDLAAQLLENQLIQSLRPPFNVSGAFTMLYPCIGLRVHERALDLCCTTSPHLLEEFAFFGAFRSARLTRAAFGSLVELLGHLGHPEPTRRLKDLPRVPFTRMARFRAARFDMAHGAGAVLPGHVAPSCSRTSRSRSSRSPPPAGMLNRSRPRYSF